jgi:hypothetical protein
MLRQSTFHGHFGQLISHTKPSLPAKIRKPESSRFGFRAALLAASSSLFLVNSLVHGAEPDYLTYETPVEDSVLDVKDIIGRGMGPTAESEGADSLTSPDDLAPFFRDTILNFEPRVYYFDRRRDTPPDSLTLAIGGALEYRSGLWLDRIGIGATLYTSQKIHGPDDKPGSGLLQPIQQGFSVLGEAFLDAHLAEHVDLRLYRQSFNLPYLNRHDIRMTPITHEAVKLFNEDESIFNYVVGHVSKIKLRTSDEFVPLSEAAGAGGTNEGMTMIGARNALDKLFNFGAINQYSWDTFNTFFAEANGAWRVTDSVAIRLSGQFTDQRSIGDELVGSFGTYNVGLKSAASVRGATITLAYSRTDDSARIRSPYGGFPGYVSLIVRDFNRAGEDAWLIGMSYDFEYVGWNGLSGFVNYASGDTPSSGGKASPDQDELGFTMDYRPRDGIFEGFWLRARAAFIDEHGVGANDLEDYRLILNYTLPLL